MKILVLGATGRTGQKFMAHAQREHTLMTFGRREVTGVSVSEVGEFGDAAFEARVRESDVVVSCLASSNSEPVCSTATKAVLAARPDVRYLTVAGAGVDHPDDQKRIPDKIVGGIMRVVAGRMLADRQAELEMLEDSQAAWTVLRPPRLVDGRATGTWRATYDRAPTSWIDRDDVALALLDMVEKTHHVRTAPFVSAAKGGTV